MTLIPKGGPIEIKHAKISAVKADFPNKEVTITLNVAITLNPDILSVATNELAFISFSDVPVALEIQQLQQVMDFTPVEVKMTVKRR